MSWGCVHEAGDGMWMYISEDGGWEEDPSASGAAVVGYNRLPFGTTNQHFTNSRFGYGKPTSVQSYSHYGFTYNSSTAKLRAYVNGELVDEVGVSGFNLPVVPVNRMMTIFGSLEDEWSFTPASQARFPETASITDISYWTRPLDSFEMRFLALSGVEFAAPATESGVIGGFIHGLGVASGIIGGWISGVPGYASGIIGGYMEGSPIAVESGVIGGYLVGLDTASGIVGGYISSQGLESGVIGGYVQALGVESGVIGSICNGGCSGEAFFDVYYDVEAVSAKDFDGSVEIQRTSNYNFDASVDLYVDKLAPSVIIEVPETTVTDVAPYFGWFVASGVPRQGKTIVDQKWDFGDLTPQVNGIPSGTHQYVTTHTYATSGIYQLMFRATDSDGITAADSRTIDLAGGVPMPDVRLEADQQNGYAPFPVQFTTTISGVPAGVTIVSQTLDFGNGQKTSATDPLHTYLTPGRYIPRLIVKDSRGFITTVHSGSRRK